jgi:hypothetical protein
MTSTEHVVHEGVTVKQRDERTDRQAHVRKRRMQRFGSKASCVRHALQHVADAVVDVYTELAKQTRKAKHQ